MLNRKQASKTVVNTNTLANPIIPKIGPKIIKPIINDDVAIILLIKTNLLFSKPNNLEV
jgi:hypothetical protein